MVKREVASEEISFSSSTVNFTGLFVWPQTVIFTLNHSVVVVVSLTSKRGLIAANPPPSFSLNAYFEHFHKDHRRGARTGYLFSKWDIFVQCRWAGLIITTRKQDYVLVESAL